MNSLHNGGRLTTRHQSLSRFLFDGPCTVTTPNSDPTNNHFLTEIRKSGSLAQSQRSPPDNQRARAARGGDSNETEEEEEEEEERH